MAKPVTVYVIVELYGGCYDDIFVSADKEMRDAVLLGLVRDVLKPMYYRDDEELQALYEEYLANTNKEEYHPDEFTLELPEEGRGFRLCEIGGCSVEELDEYVIDCKLDEASAINNRGRDAQLEYLTGG